MADDNSGLTITREGDASAQAVWLQMPGETDAHYALFNDYLLIGPSRDLLKVYASHRADGRVKVKKMEFINIDATYRDMVNRFKWRERAVTYDNYVVEQTRLRHIARMNDAIDVLYEGAVPAAQLLVAATKNARTTNGQITASMSILDRCGVVARGTGYTAPIAINSKAEKAHDIKLVVELRNASKAQLEALADMPDD